MQILSYWSLPHWRTPFDAVQLSSYDPEIGYISRPYTRAKWGEFGPDGKPIEYHVYTDRRGARVSSPGDETPAHPGIIFIGCSFTWGDGVENHDTFAVHATQGLATTAANFGLFAYGTTQALQVLRRHGDLKPKLVIYSFIKDHLQRNIAPCAPSFYPFCRDVSHVVERADGSFGIAPPKGDGVKRIDLQVRREEAWLGPVTWFAHAVDVILARASWISSQALKRDQSKQDASLQFLLEQMAQTASEFRTKLLIVRIPEHRGGEPPASLLKSVEKLRLPFLDLSSAFREYEGAGHNPPLYTTDGHPSVAGHRLISEAIISFVRQEKLLDD